MDSIEGKLSELSESIKSIGNTMSSGYQDNYTDDDLEWMWEEIKDISIWFGGVSDEILRLLRLLGVKMEYRLVYEVDVDKCAEYYDEDYCTSLTWPERIHKKGVTRMASYSLDSNVPCVEFSSIKDICVGCELPEDTLIKVDE
ncbi:hypothetical protein [Solidesulfovibrio alcoholivorans]|uniref:hypothetical protein n=1 Tax=Solidesulfovibrio alcoholivorans TaxID=81406 RepID=UPI0012EB5105|nr:hypothetical protein [Solidesulfovibrio alcoholivorans]